MLHTHFRDWSPWLFHCSICPFHCSIDNNVHCVVLIDKASLTTKSQTSNNEQSKSNEKQHHVRNPFHKENNIMKNIIKNSYHKHHHINNITKQYMKSNSKPLAAPNKLTAINKQHLQKNWWVLWVDMFLLLCFPGQQKMEEKSFRMSSVFWAVFFLRLEKFDLPKSEQNKSLGRYNFLQPYHPYPIPKFVSRLSAKSGSAS